MKRTVTETILLENRKQVQALLALVPKQGQYSQYRFATRLVHYAQDEIREALREYMETETNRFFYDHAGFRQLVTTEGEAHIKDAIVMLRNGERISIEFHSKEHNIVGFNSALIRERVFDTEEA